MLYQMCIRDSLYSLLAFALALAIGLALLIVAPFYRRR